VCGITGFIDLRGETPRDELAATAGAMAEAIAHRGPDAAGVWVDEAAGVAFGHRRLAVIDISEAGAQPMISPGGRYVICYNGEVYNFRGLRDELEAEGHVFRGHSDTEVIVNALDAWGVERTVARIRGMFAFGVWDRRDARLHLVRDRAGKKPLYYGWFGDTFAFASELKALRRHPRFEPALDRDAIGELLAYGCIPQPLSVYRQVRKLPPGTSLSLRAGDPPWSRAPAAYWTARAVAENCDRTPFAGSYAEALEGLEARLRAAVAERMVADVDLGALLSGGIDSSTVVALMQSLSDRPAKTFSIGFSEPKYNEAQHAAAVAAHLGTEHRELYVTPEEAMGVVASLPEIFDEPFADASQIPTYLVSKLAREHVTVALSGDGGDESFAGYSRYFRLIRMWREIKGMSDRTRAARSRRQRALRERGWRLLGPRDPFAGAGLNPLRRAAAKLGKRWCHWLATDLRDLQARDCRKCLDGSALVPGASTPVTSFTDPSLWADVASELLAVRQFDYVSYLVDDVLTKTDRASMAVSLELRSPLLDTEVLAYAWSLPDDYVAQDGAGKRLLKDLLARYVPRALIDRPKQGFGVPVGDWIIGPLRDWAEDLLDARRLEEDGIFDPRRVRELWARHACGWTDHSETLWAILMFQAWRARAGT
jgi:asparagine synthase (glutamine-hydrolysing)